MSFFSVFIHLGQDDAGHYITIRKDKEQWLMFDDDDVAEIQISRAESLAKSGYMFVFCRGVEVVKVSLDLTGKILILIKED